LKETISQVISAQSQPRGVRPPALAIASPEFSGAEIEEAIISALYDAFYARQESARNP